MTRSGLSVTQSLLNYRRLDTWDLLVDEMAVWARECSGKGVLLSEGYSETPLYAKDLEELLEMTGRTVRPSTPGRFAASGLQSLEEASRISRFSLTLAPMTATSSRAPVLFQLCTAVYSYPRR